MFRRRRALAACLLAWAVAPLGRPAAAQDLPAGWPNGRTITITIPFAAGGPTDTVTRLVAEAMARDLGQNVVAENVTGAGGTIAAARVATSRPDGTTLLMHHIGHATAATLYRHLPYDPLRDFAPVGLVTEVPMIVTARPGFPAKTLPELLAVMKRDGEALNLAHSGLGSANQLCGMLLQAAAGASLTTVSYRGSAPILTEEMAGRVDVFCDQATSSAPFVRDDRIQAYAVTTHERLPAPVLDTLPTVVEVGQPSLDISVWHGLYAPKGTPPEVVARLSRALQAALRDPKVIARFHELVTDVVPQDHATPDYHRRFLAAEIARWRPIIQAAGVYAD